jgi:type I restriction enzyme S subunit
MTEWREVVLGDLCDRVTVGHVGKMADEYVQEGVPFLRSQNIEPFRISLKGMLSISERFHQRLSKSTLRRDDVVVIRTGYPGTAAVVPPDLDGSNCADLVVITPSKDLNPHMLAGVFNSAWGRSAVSGQLVGSAQQHFNIGSAKALRLRLPDKEGQDRVAAVLCALSDLIEKNRRRIELLEQMAQAIYREWFVNFHYPGHEDASLVDSLLGPIPEGWEVRAVDRLVEIVKATVDPALLNPDTPAVGLEHIPRRQLTLDDWGTAGCLGSRKTYFERGDLLFGKIRPYFHKVSVAPVSGICSTDAIVIRPNSDHWGLAVFAIFSDDFVANATQTANGTKMPRADWKVIREFLVAVPPVDLARRFSAFSHDLLDAARLLMLETRELAGIRDLLLPKLVTGQIDVSELDLDALTESVA